MLIVDAFNVVHAAPATAPELLPFGLDRLVEMAGGGRFAGVPVWIVCDGTAGGRSRSGGGGSGGELPAGRSGSGVRVLFAGPGKDADSLIENLLDELERSGKAHAVTVVSSDRRVQQAAVGVRARRLTSREFLVALVEDARAASAKTARRTGGKPEFAVRDGLDTASAEAWMKEFGVGTAPNPAAPPEPVHGEAADPRSVGVGDVLDAQSIRALEEWAAGLNVADLESEARRGKKRGPKDEHR